MEKLKITKGFWRIRNTSLLNGALPENVYASQNAGDTELFAIYNTEEIIDNAILVADTGNTYQQCETLPSELLRQNREMKEALEKVLKMNYQEAEDRLGNKNKAKHWACVRTIEDCLASCNKGKDTTS